MARPSSCRLAIRAGILGLASLLLPLAAQEPIAPAESWRIVTKDSPPFAFERAGKWQGLGIELGEKIARELGTVMTVVRSAESVDGMLRALENGDADAALAAITVTDERERRVDFSHPYYVTGLGVAVRAADANAFVGIARGLTSVLFLRLFAAVLFSLVVAGLVFWWLERGKHPEFPAQQPRRAIGFGAWWSTIILLGHKGIFPRTLAGRLVAALGMLLSVLLLSALTGAIASILTVSQLEQAIRDPEDLRYLRTLTVSGTASESFLRDRLVPFRSVGSVAAGLRAVNDGDADALVHDAPILRHVVRDDFAADLRVLDRTFGEQDYAIAFPLGSAWRKPVNQAVLDLRSRPEWRELVYRYVGR